MVQWSPFPPFHPCEHPCSLIVNSSNELELYHQRTELITNFFLKKNWLIDEFFFSAKVVTIRNGKSISEKCLLLRNISGLGPVLQAVLYDVDNQLHNIIPGKEVRCCLRLSRSRFYVIRIKNAGAGMGELCNRLQNICNLVMTD